MNYYNKISILIYMILLITFETYAQWKKTSGTINVSFFLAVTGSTLFTGNNDGVYYTTDNGNNWTFSNNGLESNYSIASFTAVGNNLFVLSLYKGVYLSTDFGKNWTIVNTGITEPSSVISIFSSDTNLYAGTTNEFGIFISTNNGTNWTAVNNGLGKPGDVYSFASLGTNLFAGTSAGGVFRSTNNGMNWIQVNQGLINTDIGSLAFCDTILFAGTGDGVYRTTNNGTNWIAVNKGLANNYIYSLAASTPYLFATNRYKIFLSKNNGNNWTEVDSGLINNIRSLAILNGYIFVGTVGDGIWKKSLTDMVVSVEKTESIVPKHFVLSQNYPNPFNPTTKIEYSISKISLVTLKVYDVLGREVATLVNEEKPAGNYKVEFNESGLSSGIYFYKIQAGDYSSVKKMILIK